MKIPRKARQCLSTTFSVGGQTEEMKAMVTDFVFRILLFERPVQTGGNFKKKGKRVEFGRTEGLW